MMLLSKWSITRQGVLTRNNEQYHHRRIRIIHVDDHTLFGNGVKECIIPFFPKAKIKQIFNGTEALRFIENEIDKENKIDLIITDINHPGIPGDELIKKIRFYEDLFRRSRIPIIVLTMVEEESLQHICGPGINLITKYFSKASEADDIIETLEDILC